jgi:hypothetical protein
VTLEGELRVRLEWDGRTVRGVHIASTRPFAAARVLTGMRPADTSAMVARLYSICSCAQETASAHALAAAAQDDCAHASESSRTSVQLEAIQEYLWRILIDWPQAMGKDARVPPVADARRRIAEAQAALRATGVADVLAVLVPDLHAIAAAHVYGVSPRDFLAVDDIGALEGWMTRTDTLPAVLLSELQASLPLLGRSDVGLMPDLADQAFAEHVLPAFRLRPDFARAPDWAGVPVETGALARMQAHPLLASLRARQGNAVPVRMAARLIELATLLAGLEDDVDAAVAPRWIDTFAPATGEGIAAVQTARGMLLHRARVDAGRVAAYDIVAPTEWNFHPAGALTRGVEGMQAGDEATLEGRARLVVQGLDPCVTCRIEVGHA